MTSGLNERPFFGLFDVITRFLMAPMNFLYWRNESPLKIISNGKLFFFPEFFFYLCIFCSVSLSLKKIGGRVKKRRKKKPIFMLCRRRPSDGQTFFLLWLHTHPAQTVKGTFFFEEAEEIKWSKEVAGVWLADTTRHFEKKKKKSVTPFQIGWTWSLRHSRLWKEKKGIFFFSFQSIYSWWDIFFFQFPPLYIRHCYFS